MEAIDYDLLAEKVAEKMANIAPAEDRIWTAKDCANYLKISYNYFNNDVKKKEGFPLPINASKSRWRMSDVIEWARP